MIRLDISSLMFIYTLFSVILLLVMWVIYGYGQEKGHSKKDVDYIWKCSVCAHVYIDSKHEDLSLCPLCGSYNKREK